MENNIQHGNLSNATTKSQKRKILAHLQSVGAITPIEALNLFGCFRLSGRIKELRDEGNAIETVMIEVPSPFGGIKKVAQYRPKNEA